MEKTFLRLQGNQQPDKSEVVILNGENGFRRPKRSLSTHFANRKWFVSQFSECSLSEKQLCGVNVLKSGLFLSMNSCKCTFTSKSNAYKTSERYEMAEVASSQHFAAHSHQHVKQTPSSTLAANYTATLIHSQVPKVKQRSIPWLENASRETGNSGNRGLCLLNSYKSTVPPVNKVHTRATAARFVSALRVCRCFWTLLTALSFVTSFAPINIWRFTLQIHLRLYTKCSPLLSNFNHIWMCKHISVQHPPPPISNFAKILSGDHKSSNTWKDGVTASDVNGRISAAFSFLMHLRKRHIIRYTKSDTRARTHTTTVI